MLSSETELSRMSDAETKKKIAILKCPRYWRQETNDVVNSRTNLLKKHVKYEEEWGCLCHADCQFCKNKNECNEIVNIRAFVNYM